MAASRTPKSPDAELSEALAAAWQQRAGPHPPKGDGAVWGVACSGGRDSLALLHVACLVAAARCVAGQPTQVWALHVHHGLQPQADAWRDQVQAQCVAWQALGWPVSFDARALRLRPQAGDSIEALAREGRYRALGDMARTHGCDVVWLAHHRRDQAETLLLQALRGGGVAGLAAMPRMHRRDGVWWARPWLDVSRDAIEAHVDSHGLRPVEDGSNADVRWARNRLRLQVWPALVAACPQAEASLAQAAQHQADALASLADWLALALPRVTRGDGSDVVLHVPAWQAESPALQRQLLRGWFAQVSGCSLPMSWVQRLQAELATASARTWVLRLGGAGQGARHGPSGGLRLYRDLLAWVPHTAASAVDSVRGSASMSGPLGLGRWLIPGGGTMGPADAPVALEVRTAQRGAWGVSLADLAVTHWRPRSGGERFQLGAGRPTRSLKKQYQAMAVPAWSRTAELLWLKDELLWVPGLGVNHACSRLRLAGDAEEAATAAEALVTLDTVSGLAR